MGIDHDPRIVARRRDARGRRRGGPAPLLPAAMLALLVACDRSPEPTPDTGGTPAPTDAPTPVTDERQPGAPAADAADVENWYVVLVDGHRAGHATRWERREGDTISSGERFSMRLARGEHDVIAVEVAVESVETADGRPVELRSISGMGTGAVTTAYRFDDDGVTVTTTGAGAPDRTERLPLPPSDVLTPARERLAILDAVAAGRTEVETRSLDVSQGRLDVITTTRTDLRRTTAEVLGRTVPAITCVSRSSNVPDGTSVETFDLAGIPIRTELALGSYRIEVIAADRDLALAEIDPPEMMRQTFVTPDRPIVRPRHAVRAVYRLSLPDGRLEVPQTPTQRVTRLSATEARLEVDTSAPFGDPDDRPSLGALAPSPMLAADDPEVIAMARRAVADAPDRHDDRAERMRRAVYAAIDDKSLSVGFASASEVARTGEGDCTEHAVLLAAMLRADRIPSRIVSGLIYVTAFGGADEVFGYHMWTQGWFDPDGPGPRHATWVDLDATLPPGAPFDATHIALSTSTLTPDEAMNPLVRLVPLLGRLSIGVESVEHAP